MTQTPGPRPHGRRALPTPPDAYRGGMTPAPRVPRHRDLTSTTAYTLPAGITQDPMPTFDELLPPPMREAARRDDDQPNGLTVMRGLGILESWLSR